MAALLGTAAAVVAAAAALLLGGLVLAFRTRNRLVLGAVRRFARTVANPRVARTAGRAGASSSLVRHVGRRSGRAYATPVDAVPTDDGFLVVLPYGPGTDWVRNIRAAGTATVEHDGRTVPVDHPEVVPLADADRWFTPGQQRVHRLYGVRDVLRLRSAAARPGRA
jgi:deazaflavin-dependent oxidoreductase (nitroreductase family)